MKSPPQQKKGRKKSAYEIANKTLIETLQAWDKAEDEMLYKIFLNAFDQPPPRNQNPNKEKMTNSSGRIKE